MNYQKQMDLITACTCKINLLYGELARKHGMSYYTLMVLLALEAHQPCTQKQIAEKWLLPKQTVNTVIKDLQKKGYVELAAGRNQKEKLVALTEAGRSSVQETLLATHRLEEQILKQIGEQESQAIVHGFQKFAAIFEAELSHYEP